MWKGKSGFTAGLGCREARRIPFYALVLQSPTKCIYLTNVTQNSLVADEGLFNGSKTGETFPTFFFLVSVYVSIKKKKKRGGKKNGAGYSSNRTTAYIWEVAQISLRNWLGKYKSLYFLKAISDFFPPQRTETSNPDPASRYFYPILFRF